MRLFLVRHGRTEFNADGRFQPVDSSLSARGLQQAKQLAGRLEGISFDHVYSSDSARAVATSKVITKAEIQKTRLLGPLKKPSEVVGKLHKDPEVVAIHKEIDSHREDSGWHYSDEENYYDFRDRVNEFLRQVSEEDGRVLAVTHSLVVRLIVSLVVVGEELSATEFDKLRWRLHATNTGITELSHRDRGWRVETFNDVAHL